MSPGFQRGKHPNAGMNFGLRFYPELGSAPIKVMTTRKWEGSGMEEHRRRVSEKVLVALLLRPDCSLKLTNDPTTDSHDRRRFPSADHTGQTSAHDLGGWGERTNKRQGSRQGSH